MNKNFKFTSVILIAAFFLVVLGMRNTSLDNSNGPKQRPRAVVEDASKAPISICSEQHLDAAVIRPAVTVITISEALTFCTPVVSSPSIFIQHFFPSRASPSLSRLS